MSEDNTRTALLAAIEELARAVPKVRIGQLLAAVGEEWSELYGRGLWDLSDAELLDAVSWFHINYEYPTITSDEQET